MKDSELNIHLNNNQNTTNLNIDFLTNEEKTLLIKQNYHFFLEYSKLFQTNELLKTKLQELINEKNQLKSIINKLEKEENNKKINDPYTKRKVI
jgi:predicted nuclease with TOPRIM domain